MRNITKITITVGNTGTSTVVGPGSLNMESAIFYALR